LLKGFDECGTSSIRYEEFVAWVMGITPGELSADRDLTRAIQMAAVCMQEVATPVCCGSNEERQRFLEKEWAPFIAELRDALASTQTRHALGFSPEEVLPPRESWIAWADRNRQLTTKWYGRPNVSVLYELLIECGLHDGDSVYRTSELRQEWSEDRWVRTIDGKARKAAYKKRDEMKATRTYATSQKAGESMIDNSILPNIMTAAESHVLLAGKIIKDFMVRRIAKQQRKCLVVLAKLPSVPTPALGLLPPEELREVLGALSNEDLVAAGINPESSAFQALRATGRIIASFGQFTADQRNRIQQFIQTTLGCESPSGKRQELDDFVAFIHEHPGRIYKDDGHLHHELLNRVLFSKHYVVVKRSTMAQFAAHRYFTNGWKRTYPLIEFSEEGVEKELRPSGADEFSRFRKNDFPYLDSHGMSLSSGGVVEGSDAYGGLLYELGVSCAVDGTAKVGNWFASDFEKILKEVVALNPASSIEKLLPGEAFHEVCQNPRASSSIRETEHVQISRGSSSMWPVMRLQQKPIFISELGATLDIVQVGNELDAIHVCLESEDIAAPAIVKMLNELRLTLCRKCGPKIDFILLATPRGDGKFRAAFVPLASVEARPGVMKNVLLGEELGDYNLPWGPLVDSTSGKGNMVVFDANGWTKYAEGAAPLQRLYDFNRFPGTRALVAEFLKDHYAYIDDSPGKCLSVEEPIVPSGGIGPSLIDTLFPDKR